ncbi:pectin acetylesterase 8-like [Nicotiana tabacum]|uniref:Pectin acetylesterase 8-like n=1 Tax=Nicotiana tabacum TaxID=4097 RepID=A0AC58TX38_TOBAC
MSIEKKSELKGKEKREGNEIRKIFEPRVERSFERRGEAREMVAKDPIGFQHESCEINSCWMVYDMKFPKAIAKLESLHKRIQVCLDGSPPAYHLDIGHGSGLRSWIIVMDGGGWCESIPDCLSRSTTKYGSTKHMKNVSWFAGILDPSPRDNPEFYNWNRVRVKYCDGSSFTGDAILSGVSRGGLATILNCDKFKSLLPNDARVKCVADAGFFINGRTISGSSDIQEIYERVITLHGSAKNLPPSCTSAMEPNLVIILMFFPQNVVPYVQTPLFISNSDYDSWQIENILVPKYLDPQQVWKDFKSQISNCTFGQRIIIQAFGVEFLKAFEGLTPSFTRGYFITSCHSHGAILSTNFWFSPASPRLLHKTIAEAVGDWYFDRAGFQCIDPYPCARDCKL